VNEERRGEERRGREGAEFKGGWCCRDDLIYKWKPGQ